MPEAPPPRSTEEAPLLSDDRERDGGMAPDRPDSNRGVDGSLVRLYAKNNWADPWSLIAQGGIVIFFITVWIIVVPKPAGLFSYHPPFQTAAILLFTQGVLALQPTRTALAKRTGLTIHEGFQLLGTVALIIGTSFILYNKDIHGAPHFTSWHGTLGIITFILVLLQTIFGALIGFEATRSLFGGDAKVKSLWKYHRAVGYAVFIFFVATALTATQADWVVMNASEQQVNVWIIALLIGAIGIAGRINVRKIVPR